MAALVGVPGRAEVTGATAPASDEDGAIGRDRNDQTMRSAGRADPTHPSRDAVRRVLRDEEIALGARRDAAEVERPGV